MGAKETKVVVSELKKQRDYHKEEADKLQKTIKQLQEVCTHKLEDGSDAMEWYGNDSHKDYYRCTICGKEDWY